MAFYPCDLGGNELEEVKNTLGYTVGKNLLEVTAINRTIGGITFTFNADKSVTANGTASSIGLCPVNPLFRLPNGEYILSGCPEGGSESSYRLDIVKYNDSSDRIAIDIGQGATFTIDSEDPMVLRAYINSGTTVDNLTFYPMIRKADITDDTYVPYKDDVDTRLEELKSTLDTKANSSDLTWKSLMTASGASKTITLPTTMKEVLLASDTNNSCYSTMITGSKFKNAFASTTAKHFHLNGETYLGAKKDSSGNTVVFTTPSGASITIYYR